MSARRPREFVRRRADTVRAGSALLSTETNAGRNRVTAEYFSLSSNLPVASVHDVVRLLQHNERPAAKKQDLKSLCVSLLKHSKRGEKLRLRSGSRQCPSTNTPWAREVPISVGRLQRSYRLTRYAECEIRLSGVLGSRPRVRYMRRRDRGSRRQAQQSSGNQCPSVLARLLDSDKCSRSS